MDFWSLAALLAIGFALGVFVGAKYINIPSTEYNLGKIKIKGENTVTIPEIKIGSAEKVEEKRGLIKRILKRTKNAKNE
jgi:hypothetical protein